MQFVAGIQSDNMQFNGNGNWLNLFGWLNNFNGNIYAYWWMDFTILRCFLLMCLSMLVWTYHVPLASLSIRANCSLQFSAIQANSWKVKSFYSWFRWILNVVIFGVSMWLRRLRQQQNSYFIFKTKKMFYCRITFRIQMFCQCNEVSPPLFFINSSFDPKWVRAGGRKRFRILNLELNLYWK